MLHFLWISADTFLFSEEVGFFLFRDLSQFVRVTTLLCVYQYTVYGGWCYLSMLAVWIWNWFKRQQSADNLKFLQGEIMTFTLPVPLCDQTEYCPLYEYSVVALMRSPVPFVIMQYRPLDDQQCPFLVHYCSLEEYYPLHDYAVLSP